MNFQKFYLPLITMSQDHRYFQGTPLHTLEGLLNVNVYIFNFYTSILPYFFHSSTISNSSSWQLSCTLSPAICTSIFMFHVDWFYPLKFTSLTIGGQNPPLKTIPYSFTGRKSVSANSRQSSSMSIGCSPQAFQTLQLFWGVLTLNKNWASYRNHLGVLGPNIDCFAQSFFQG